MVAIKLDQYSRGGPSHIPRPNSWLGMRLGNFSSEKSNIMCICKVERNVSKDGSSVCVKFTKLFIT